MTCDDCGSDKAILYSSPSGAMLIKLCPRCVVKYPLVRSVTPQTAACRPCRHLGHCCRTANHNKPATPAGTKPEDYEP